MNKVDGCDRAKASKPRHLWQRAWPAIAVLIGGCLMTAAGALYLAQEARRYDERRFASAIHEIMEEIDNVMEKYEAGLARLQDLFTLEKDLGDITWRNHIELMNPGVNFSAFMEIGYAPWLSRNAQSYVYNDIEGRAYAIDKFPALSNAFNSISGTYAMPVLFHYSADGLHFAGIEYNLMTESNGAQAPYVERAFKDAALRISPMHCTMALKAGKPRKGIRMYAPIYPIHKIPPTERESQEAAISRRLHGLKGAIFATVDLDHLLHSKFEGRKLDIAFEIFDQEPNVNTNLLSRFPAQMPLLKGKPYLSSLQSQPQYGRRWHLSFHSLPSFKAGSRLDRVWLWLGAGLLLSCATSLTLLAQVQARIREENISMQLLQSRDQLTLVVQERERLSRSLHDGTIQSVYGLGLQVAHLQKLICKNPEQAIQELEVFKSTINEVIFDLRQYLLCMEPEILRGKSFDNVLTSMVERLRQVSEINLELQIDPAFSPKLNPGQALCLLHIAREAIYNCLRHARPGWIRISVKGTEDEGVLEIADNGIGFQIENVHASGKGLGNMVTRAEEVGGALEIQSDLGLGTRIKARLPLDRKNRLWP